MPARTVRSTRTARQYRGIVNALARNVRRLRSHAGWSQEEAAHQSELSLRVYQRVEAATVNLTMTTLACLCQAFELQAWELLRSPRD